MMQQKQAARIVAAVMLLTLATMGAAQPSWLTLWFWWTPESVQEAIDAGADVNARDEYGLTPLMRAVSPEKPDVVRVLLAAGANLEARDLHGWTVLMHAVMHEATATLRLLIDAEANLEASFGEGVTALSLAAAVNREPDVLHMLLDAGADGTARDKDGRTAFDWASENTALRGTDAYWRLNDARFR
jgi:uncharacterized protein